MRSAPQRWRPRHAAGFALLWAAAISGVSCSPPEKQSERDGQYELNLDLLVEPGFKYRVQTRGEYTLADALTQNGRVVDQARVSATLDVESDAEVLAVDSKGQPVRVAYTVRRANAYLDGQPVDSLQPGMIIEVDGLRPDSKPRGLPEGLDRYVELLCLMSLYVSKPESPTYTELFGTQTKKDVGDSWEARTEFFKDEGLGAGYSYQGAAMSGTVRAAGIDFVRGFECVRVDARIDAKNYRVPREPGMTIRRSDVFNTFSFHVPTDPTKRLRKMFQSFRLEVDAGVPAGDFEHIVSYSVESTLDYSDE